MRFIIYSYQKSLSLKTGCAAVIDLIMRRAVLSIFTSDIKNNESEMKKSEIMIIFVS